MKKIKEISEYLYKSGVQYFATIGLDGKPKVRPFHFMFEESGKLWFCTSNQKEVYKELQAQPYIELSIMGDKMSWIRVAGKVTFADDIKIKEKIFVVSPMVKGIYGEVSNPILEVFYLSEISAAITEIGKEPLVYTMD